MTNLTPADLARFIHPVPVGAVIPAATEHAVRTRDGDTFTVMTMAYDHEQAPGALDRWTADPIWTPERQRLEDEYAAACEAVYAAERKVREANAEREARGCTAQRLYDRLKSAGYR